MTRVNRETLRQHFRAGSRPTSDHFTDLVDSTVNIAEDGICKNERDGLQLRALADSPGLMSLYRAHNAGDADWSLAFGDAERRLALRAGAADPRNLRTPLLTLDAPAPDAPPGEPGRMGVGTATPRPEARLDVAGAIGATGRLGSAAAVPGPVPADGRFHRITPRLQGCRALEVVAGVGQPDQDGRFALTHAIALNAHNPSRWDDWFGRRTRIRQHDAWYARSCDRLQLRWEGEHGKGGTYWLAIRTRCDYQVDARRLARRQGRELPPADEVLVRVFVTELWFDPSMAGCRQEPTR